MHTPQHWGTTLTNPQLPHDTDTAFTSHLGATPHPSEADLAHLTALLPHIQPDIGTVQATQSALSAHVRAARHNDLQPVVGSETMPDDLDPRYFDRRLLGPDFETLNPRDKMRRFSNVAQRVENTPRHVDLTITPQPPIAPTEGLFRTMHLWFPNRGCFADASAVWIWLGMPEEHSPTAHTVVSPQRWRPPRGIVHRESRNLGSDVTTHLEMTLTTPLRSVCDLLRFGDVTDAIALTRAAFTAGLTTSDEVAQELKRFARQKHVTRALDRLIAITAQGHGIYSATDCI